MLIKKLIYLCVGILLAACAAHNSGVSPANGGVTQFADKQDSASESSMPVLVEQEAIKQEMPNAILFDLYESKVNEQFMPIIAWNAGYLKQFPNAKVEIQGNADDKHNSTYDEKLAWARAQNVKDVLLFMGVNDQQITIKSLGNKHPVYPKDNDGYQPRNQRVDIMYTFMPPPGYHIDKVPVVITTTGVEAIIPEPIN